MAIATACEDQQDEVVGMVRAVIEQKAPGARLRVYENASVIANVSRNQ